MSWFWIWWPFILNPWFSNDFDEKTKMKFTQFWKMLQNLWWFRPFGLKLCKSIDLDELVLNMMSVSSESLIFDRYRWKNRIQNYTISKHASKLRLVSSVWAQTLPIYRSRWAGFEYDDRLFWILDFRMISMEKQKPKLLDFR